MGRKRGVNIKMKKEKTPFLFTAFDVLSARTAITTRHPIRTFLFGRKSLERIFPSYKDFYQAHIYRISATDLPHGNVIYVEGSFHTFTLVTDSQLIGQLYYDIQDKDCPLILIDVTLPETIEHDFVLPHTRDINIHIVLNRIPLSELPALLQRNTDPEVYSEFNHLTNNVMHQIFHDIEREIDFLIDPLRSFEHDFEQHAQNKLASILDPNSDFHKKIVNHYGYHITSVVLII